MSFVQVHLAPSIWNTSAAYNAGPTNAKRWLAAYGDPRSASVDPIDWIEQIPFNETRNYVQRVVENLEIYRGRLAGRDQSLRILADLYGANAPKVLVYTPPPPQPAFPSRWSSRATSRQVRINLN